MDLHTQPLLNYIKERAEDQGMRINTKKTGLMLVSAATSFEPRVRLEIGGETICGADSLKVLGVTIDRDATFKSHVSALAAKLRSKTWALTRKERTVP